MDYRGSVLTVCRGRKGFLFFAFFVFEGRRFCWCRPTRIRWNPVEIRRNSVEKWEYLGAVELCSKLKWQYENSVKPRKIQWNYMEIFTTYNLMYNFEMFLDDTQRHEYALKKLLKSRTDDCYNIATRRKQSKSRKVESAQKWTNFKGISFLISLISFDRVSIIAKHNLLKVMSYCKFLAKLIP